MRIALDAMGGDNAPYSNIEGAIAAAPNMHGEILLVGDPSAVKANHSKPLPPNVKVIAALQVIEMHEQPAAAVRRKKDSSLVVASNLVRDGEAEAMISAGNTGAITAAAHLYWKCVPSVSRPAIATVLPSKKGHFVLLDSGATPDADAQNLLQFAVMGSVYSEMVLGINKPRVGLLNIGVEETKGNVVTKEAFQLLHKGVPNFVGNVEGKTLFDGECDVVVCDAFVGNVLLKSAESLAQFVLDLFSSALSKNPLLKLPLIMSRKALSGIKRRVDYAEYGGAPLLGVNGICFICHGHSSARAIKNAILLAQRGPENDLINTIAQRAVKVQDEVNCVS